MEEGLGQVALGLGQVDASTYSPLALAYLGDGVYELIIRTRVMSRGNTQVEKMHKKSASLVNAAAQANMARKILGSLTKEEEAVYKRGRNAKSGTMAKHATMADYRTATGFEALVGHLYLTGQYSRLIALVSQGLREIGELE